MKHLPLSILVLVLAVSAALGAQEATVAPVASEGKDALVAYQNRQYQQAIDITLGEIKARPDNMNSYAVLCWSLNATRRYQEAIKWATEGRRYNPGDHRMSGALAESHFALGNYVQAIAFYQQYIGIVTRLPGYDTRYIRDSYRDLAECFRKTGELHHADMALVAAIQWNTGSSALDAARLSDFWFRLGGIRKELGDRESAIKAFQEALKGNPQLEAARTALEELQA